MGYCVKMTVDVVIEKAKKDLALQAINRMYMPEMLEKYASGGCSGHSAVFSANDCQKWYSWQNNHPGPFYELGEAIKAWRYYYKYRTNGDMHINSFTGEKWGDDELFYQAIAPFVQKDSTIKIRGEDLAEWQYNFKNGQVTSSEGKMRTFEDFNVDDLKLKMYGSFMLWDKNPPTKDGVYFCTLGERQPVSIVKFYEDGTIEEFGTDQTSSLTQNYNNHWWHGPLNFPSNVGLKKLKTIVVEED